MGSVGREGCCGLRLSLIDAIIGVNSRDLPMIESIRNEQGKVMMNKVKHLLKSLGFRIEGDAKYGYKLEIGERELRAPVEPVDWDRLMVDKTYVEPEWVVIRESTLREYRLTKEELIKAADKYLSLVVPAVI